MGAAVVYGGDNGKRAVLALPPMGQVVLQRAGKTAGDLAVESNRSLLGVLAPYFDTDTWGAATFAWWLLKRVSSAPSTAA